MLRRSFLSATGLLTAGCLVGCSGGPIYRYRYKLTMTVDANDRVLSSANVVEVIKRGFSRGILTAAGVGSNVTGEANVIEIMPGRLLVALLRSIETDVTKSYVPRTGWYDAAPSFLLQRLYGTPRLGMDENNISPGLEALEHQRGAWDIGPEDLPTLVTFGDPAIPTSVRQVNPRDLAATFGPGVRLSRATIEVTEEPITRGIEKHLPWVGHVKGNLHGEIGGRSNELDQRLSSGAFKMDGI